MRGCARCGEQSDDRSRFCWSCGAVLEDGPASAREVRKVVTIVFCDVVGSTAIGERQDPEQLRWLMSRYFEEMSAIVSRHGGTVGKFIGDAVMAVFGAPVLHEDDALRAIRAAAAMREAVDALNVEFESSLGVRIEVRIGINSGEVIAGDASRSDTLVTGDAVNTASRLEVSAGSGEILIGEGTYALARDEIHVEALPPLAVKGKERRLRAYRLLGDAPVIGVRAQRFSSAFVDRDAELALIRETALRAIGARSCHLLTVLGQPGVGKSRLVAEAIRDAAPASTVLQGNCLPYGEGITFWPVVEIVRQAARADEGELDARFRDKLAPLLAGEEDAAVIVEGVSELVGAGGGRRPAEELFWAVRKLLEAIARRGPVVVVFDDIHWGEATLLDLVEHLAEWSRGVPLLLICIARPELHEIRPSWGGGRVNAASIFLDPLNEPESERLMDHLLGDTALLEEVRGRIHAAAEGYPLFFEEIVSMLVDDGLVGGHDQAGAADADGERLRVPATINLLLASRIDRLPAAEREVLACASVEGRTFHRSAVEHLSRSSAGAELERLLAGLVRKDLIRPERSQLRGEDAFRFRHILIRDAAYESLRKQARAELHERFATWLVTTTGDKATEYDEFVGYHLERAFRYRTGLHHVERTDRELAGRAGAHLAAAGSRARVRGDVPAAVKLLRRAVVLMREDHGAPPQALIDLGAVLVEIGDLAGGDAAFAEAMEAASGRADTRLATWAALERSNVRSQIDPGYDARRLREVAETSIPVFEECGDWLGVATALTRVAETHWIRCRFAAAEQVLEQALVYAERAGDQRETVEILELLGRAMVIGPRPVDEAIRRCRAILEQAREHPRLEAWTNSMLAVLEAMRGRHDEARVLYRHSQRAFADLGLKMMLAGAHMYWGVAELTMGEPRAAEREFRRGYAALDALGERATLPTMAAFLARALVQQARYEEAERLTVVSEQSAASDDLASQVLWRGARARALAHRGEVERAELLARDAAEMADTSDFLTTRADVMMDLAHVVHRARPADADAVVAEAVALYEAKGNSAAATAARGMGLRWRAPSQA
jgi:class 3 adenylate cyclase/tetratricopeptide (TPR) repeat protein